MAEQKKPTGPDLTEGIALSDLSDGGMLQGHVGKEAVLVARRGEEYFAIGARCTHYGGPLAQGLMVGDTVRCPWHFACFSLRTGEAERAPALDPVSCWKAEKHDGRIVVREKSKPAPHPPARRGAEPGAVVIVGGGAAGNAAAEMLRREGYTSRIAMISADDTRPYDRPNLSKDYLAGSAQEDWIPLRSPNFYEKHDIELLLGTRVTTIDSQTNRVHLSNGEERVFDALLLAPGAEPVRLPVPGADLPHVHYLRTFTDCQAIVAKAEQAKQVVIVGSGFIGMEAAASLRNRKLEVHVVSEDERPMERVLGPELGDHMRRVHEKNGVSFHLKDSVAAIDEREVALKSGANVAADLVLVGIGVRPRIDLAEAAGIETDRGIAVNEYLETSAPGIFAAGDVARWPDPLTGERIRVEHWIVAERQGQTVARNILGRRERYGLVPVFWTNQFDLRISYVGYAETWDSIEVDGDIAAQDCTARFVRGGRTLAVVTIGRNRAKLEAEVELEAEAARRA